MGEGKRCSWEDSGSLNTDIHTHTHRPRTDPQRKAQVLPQMLRWNRNKNTPTPTPTHRYKRPHVCGGKRKGHTLTEGVEQRDTLDRAHAGHA